MASLSPVTVPGRWEPRRLSLSMLCMAGVDSMPLRSLSECSSWHYQLQGTPAVEDVRDVDLLVIDGDEDPSPYLDGARQVAAYISIGEAEGYRSYFSTFPRSLLFPVNPKWPSNYPVHFWHSKWEEIVLARAKEMQKKGFTALYLDKVDVVEDLEQRFPGEFPADVRMRMYVLLMKIRQAVPGMALIQQNAETILPLTQHVIDAVGVEDLYYGEDDVGMMNDAQSISRREQRLMDSGKPVFLVEYLNGAIPPWYAKKSAARKAASVYSYPIFFADCDRSLSG